MVDLKTLNDLLEDSGIKKHYVANKLNIASNTLRLKLEGASDFKIDEVSKLCKLLGLTTEQRDAIFFCEEENENA